MLKALLSPFGLVLLLGSLALAVLAQFVVNGWPGQAPSIALLGFLAYVASVAVLHKTQPFQEDAIDSEAIGLAPKGDEAGEQESLIRRPLVQKALQQLNRLPALSQSELIPLLPRTIASTSVEPNEERSSDGLTPLEKAQALRKILISGIEQLRPTTEATGPGAKQALEYHILREAYIEKKPVVYFLHQYHISEAHYHRNRVDAIEVLAHQFHAKEQMLGGDEAEAAETG